MSHSDTIYKVYFGKLVPRRFSDLTDAEDFAKKIVGDSEITWSIVIEADVDHKVVQYNKKEFSKHGT